MATYTQVVPSGGDAQELLAKIQRTHLSYLQLDNSSQKLKSRWKLEDLITSHLSTVPHKEKFPCPRFLEILRRSVEDKVDFYASSAARAFDILNTYAENLISQPWRKEFRCLKLYNGFYKHYVESQLSCNEEIFNMMGYEDGEFMEMNLEGPVDPDRVIDVSLNCLIAVVECKMMGEIMEKVGDSTWQEIASIRRHNVCGVAKAVQIVTRNTLKKSRSSVYSEDKPSHKALTDARPNWINPSKNNSRYVKVEKLVDAPWNNDGELMEADRRYPPYYYDSTWEEKPPSNGHHHHFNNHHQQLQLQPQHQHFDSDFFIPKTTDEHINLQNLCVNDGHSLQQKYTPGAPEVGPRNDSWGYIERMQQQQQQWPTESWKKLYLDSQSFIPNQPYPLNRSSSATKQMQAPTVDDIYRSVLCRRTFPPKLYSSSSLQSHDPGLDPICVNSPSYLYVSRPTLMSDHIYRANVHYPVAPITSNYEVLPKINNSTPTVVTLQKTDSQSAAELCDATEKVKMAPGDSKRRSWYDNVDSTESESQVRRTVHNGDVLPPPTQFQNDPEVKVVQTPLGSIRNNSGHRRWPSDGSAIVKSDRDANKFISSASFDGKVTSVSGWSSKDEAKEIQPFLRSNTLPKAEVRPPGTWSCLACTYLNLPGNKICEMCSRSRRPGAESDPLSSGGHECQKCTLVNEKGAPKCLACGHSLENSPTYV